EGQAGEVLRRQPDGHRWAVCRNQGAHWRLLALDREIDGRSGRVAEAGTVRWRDGSRDPAALRVRRFRERVHPGTAGAGGAAARENRRVALNASWPTLAASEGRWDGPAGRPGGGRPVRTSRSSP